MTLVVASLLLMSAATKSEIPGRSNLRSTIPEAGTGGKAASPNEASTPSVAPLPLPITTALDSPFPVVI